MARSPRDGWSIVRRRAKAMLPLAIVLTLHALLIAALISTRAPPVGQAVQVREISLVQGLDRSMAAIAPPPQPLTISPAPAQDTDKPVAAETESIAPAPERVLALTPLPEPVPIPQPDLTSVVATLAKSGLNLMAEPPTVNVPAVEAASTTLSTAGDKRCQIAATLQATLRDDPEIRTALALIPAASRSIANAIVLWDGQWIDSSSVGGAEAFDPIARRVVDTVDQASLRCRDETIRGVQFIILADARNTFVLAFGSGEWRWADVVATSARH